MIQTCTHCGFINANADEHTIFCPNCGEPYPALRDMTVQVPQVQPRGDSSPFAPYGTSPYAAPYTPGMRSGVAPPPPPGVSGTRSVAPQRRGRAGGFIGGMLLGLGLIMLVVTVVAAAALARGNKGVVAQTATATPSPTHVRPTATAQPTVVALTTYNDPSQRFSVQYPANWATNVNATSGDGDLPAYVTTFSNADVTPKLFEVLVTPQRLSSSSLNTFVQNSGGTHYHQTGTTASASYAGADWKVVTGTFTSKNGVPLTAQMLYTRHSNITTYALFLVTSQDQFDVLTQKTFTPMLQSFTFGNNPA